jgi:hypothetical protein
MNVDLPAPFDREPLIPAGSCSVTSFSLMTRSRHRQVVGRTAHATTSTPRTAENHLDTMMRTATAMQAIGTDI